METVAGLSQLKEPVTQHIDFVRKHSPFYASLYSSLPEGPLNLEDLPVLNPIEFWAVNPTQGNELLTTPHIDGVIFATGGTTAAPKVTIASKGELKISSQNFAQGMIAAGLQPGDRVANFFVAGDLYSSFLLVSLAVLECPIPAVLIPLGFALTPLKMIAHLRDQSATVVMGIATTITKIAVHIVKSNETLPGIHLLLFAGEHLYQDQRSLISRAFPKAQIHSLSYGSMDAGMLGVPVAYNGDARVHRANSPTIVLEIIDDEGRVITETGKPGVLLCTNLCRRLVPVVRYPVGDIVEWVDYSAGLFRVLGRDQKDVRVGVVSIEAEQLRSVIEEALSTNDIKDFRGMQVILERRELRDQMIFSIACNPGDKELAAGIVNTTLHKLKPWFKEHVDAGFVQPLEVRWIDAENLEVNDRTGKTPLLIDRRL